MKKYLFITTILVLTILTYTISIDNVKINVKPRIKSSGSPKASVESKKMRLEYFFNMLKNPKTNSIPVNMREIELEYSKKISVLNRLQKVNDRYSILWKEAGPNDLGGRTRALAIDTKNSNIVLAGGVSGGIWKSTDKGNSWILKTVPNEVQSVVAIAQDTRDNFTNIWYYSSGEYSGSAGDRSGTAMFYGGGVYKSTDNGETWNLLINTKPTDNIKWNNAFSYTNGIAISPITGSLFVASNSGVIARSADGGENFNFTLGTTNEHINTDVKVNLNGTILASLSQRSLNAQPQQFQPGLYYSADDGLTWKIITSQFIPSEHDKTVLAFSNSNPNIAYALMNTGSKLQGSEADDLRLLKIDLSTEQVEDLSEKIQVYINEQNGYLNTQDSYNMAIAVHPTNENIIFIGLTNVYRTLDGFATKIEDKKLNWIGGYTIENNNSSHPALHPDVHNFVFDQNNPDHLWVVHDGGLSFTTQASTTNYDNLFPWENKDNTYNVTQYYTMSISNSENDSRILGGTQDNGTPYFRFDGTNATSHQDVSTGDGSYSYMGTNYSYVSTQNGNVTRLGYDDGGNPDPTIWSNIKPKNATGQLFINPFTVDPSNENYMYYIAGNMLWRNNELSSIPDYDQDPTEQGWSSIDLNLPQDYIFTAVSVSRNPAHIVYLGAYSDSGNPIILKMENSLNSNTAVDISPNLPEVTSGSYVSSIAINPQNANELILCYSNYGIIGLFYTSDGGSNWQAIEGNLQGGSNHEGPSIRAASILPYGNTIFYLLATSTGVYSSQQLNGMNTVWSLEGGTLIGNIVVEALATRMSDGVIIAATHGRGAFRGNITGSVSSTEQNEIPVKFSLDQNFPNPFNPETTIAYSLDNPYSVKLKIFDITGKEVLTLVDKNQVPGKYQINFNSQSLASGIYFYRLEAGSYIQTKKMVLLK